MKRMLCILLTLVMLLCGCQSAAGAPADTQGQTEEMTEETAENVTQSDVEIMEMETPGVTLPFVEQETGNGIDLGATGCVRVAYNGAISSVRYITSVEQLPDHEALAAYDEAYFADKALIVVYETVGSGSVRVGIESIENGVVTLSHELPGDAGTADMATWLLWAEVDTGLDDTWSVANPAVEPNTSTH
ncbi:MAG: hypothetical protein IJZ39_01045 [Oscillospiraceae bacterium]|nr:hypothetical protein [Oscillospiraceae bacterium]